MQSLSLTKLGALLIDMDGVLYRGMTPIPGAKAFLAFAEEQGIRFLLFTNNSTLTPEQYVEKLAGMDIQVTPEQIFTSAQATAMYLPKILKPGATVYMIGQDGLRTALLEAGYRLVDNKHADAVVMGMDRQVNYEKMRIATLAIRGGAVFVGTNPDVTFPSEEGIVPGTGAILAAVELSAETKPFIVGKPEKPIFDIALERLGARAEDTAMIGDRPETDILGGQRAGVKTIFVTSGVAGVETLRIWNLEPDWIYDDLAALHQAWLSELG